jgi:hypothetical protein
MDRKRLKYYFGFLLFACLILFEAQRIGDLDIYLQGSKDLFKSENIYKNTYQEWFHYYYDIPFAIIIYPLSFIPLYCANVIWSLANLFCTYRLWRILNAYLLIQKLSKKSKQIFTWVFIAMIFTLWHRNIHLTQITILIMWLCLEGALLLDNKKYISGALLMALGISIKILPLVMLPYYLYKGRWKEGLSICLALLFITMLPGIVIGWDYQSFLLLERWKILNPANSEHILDVSERSFHSITSLFSTLFVENARNQYSLHLKRNIADVSLETLKLYINIARLFFVAFTLYFLRDWPFKNTGDKVKTWWELSYLLLVIPLIFPHQQHYAFFFAAPAIAYCIYFAVSTMKWETMTKTKKVAWYTLSFIIFFLLSSHFVLGVYQNYYNHFKTLTYGVILIIPVLAWMRPNKILLS